jgi:hypothetical protein
MAKNRHPLEYIAARARLAEDPYSKMTENSLLLTNFPKDLNVNEAFVMELCLNNGAGKSRIREIRISETFKANLNDNDRAAYAIVDFESAQEVQSVKQSLWKHWIKDKLLKLKTLEDREIENFHDRTLIVTNFESHATQFDLAKVFG